MSRHGRLSNAATKLRVKIDHEIALQLKLTDGIVLAMDTETLPGAPRHPRADPRPGDNGAGLGLIATALDRAVAAIGIQGAAQACGVSYHAARKWVQSGRLPRTEWTGETDYAGVLCARVPGLTRADFGLPAERVVSPWCAS